LQYLELTVTMVLLVTGQLADTPTRRQSNSPTDQLADN